MKDFGNLGIQPVVMYDEYTIDISVRILLALDSIYFFMLCHAVAKLW